MTLSTTQLNPAIGNTNYVPDYWLVSLTNALNPANPRLGIKRYLLHKLHPARLLSRQT